jgi:DNA-binding response OmpR family regulator
VPVVILTSSSEDHDVINGYDLGANSYVSKPIQSEEFATAVARLERDPAGSAWGPGWPRRATAPTTNHVRPTWTLPVPPHGYRVVAEALARRSPASARSSRPTPLSATHGFVRGQQSAARGPDARVEAEALVPVRLEPSRWVS